jgi:hypothetical protein
MSSDTLTSTQNNANEGSPFVPRDINTKTNLVSWLEDTFSMFASDGIAKILLYRAIMPRMILRPLNLQL